MRPIDERPLSSTGARPTAEGHEGVPLTNEMINGPQGLPTPPIFQLRAIVEHALAEDLGRGDITTDSLVPAGLMAEARIMAKADGVLAGLPVARLAFEMTGEVAGSRTAQVGNTRTRGSPDPSIAGSSFTTFEPLPDDEGRPITDGARILAGQEIARIVGPARAILSAERVALNFLQRLSGTATLAAQFVDAVAGTGARIVDTRKTTPGLRLLEKYAVRCGGASNHRYDLGAAVMAKDNHLAALAAAGVPLPEAIRAARARIPPTTMIEIEVARLDQLDEVLEARPDLILLDNMSPAELTAAIERIGGRARTEASGGIMLESVRAIAETGVDLISVGALTHSAPALDISLDFVVQGKRGDLDPVADSPRERTNPRDTTKNKGNKEN